MAHRTPLPESTRQDILLQIARRLPEHAALAPPGAGPTLGESLKVRVLPFDKIDRSDEPLDRRFKDTGLWHHQVSADGPTPRFARSLTAPGSTEHKVVEVGESSLPQHLDRAFHWIDENIPQDAEAEVLVVPSHFITAVWLHGAGVDGVVVTSAGSREPDLPSGVLIPSEDFLRKLADLPPVGGLGPPPDPPSEEKS